MDTKFANKSVKELNSLLKERIIEYLPEQMDLNFENGVSIHRKNIPNVIISCVESPFIILMINGEKHSKFGDKSYIYGPNTYLITHIDYPVSSYVTNISEDDPYLSILIKVDKNIIAELLQSVDNIESHYFEGLSITNADEDILHSFYRLLDILDKPADSKILMPMIIKEIHYRILTGPIGRQLKSLYTYGSKSNRILQAVDYLRNNFKTSIKIEELAKKVNMASSTFNRNFKNITSLSPLQYQKRLRLYEAQRLMLVEDYNVTSASYEVGYESINQFTREYKEMFGNPPLRDIKSIIKS